MSDDLAAELSRALGEIDAAHVDLDRLGVTRCDGEALQDRIARFGDTAQSQAEEMREVLTAATLKLADKLAAAEQREAEKHKDAMIAHRWFASRFGDVMNGRDFAAKCAMADAAQASPSTPSPAPSPKQEPTT